MPDVPPLIPNFTLIRRIGRGAYGEVWLARSVTGVHRAVKIVRRDSFGDLRPFEREFAGLQRIEPISVGQESQVSLLHVGRNEAEGFFYYVMELADDVETGEEIFPERYVPKTLKELRARRCRLPASECLDIGLALTRALAHLHANGLVHRDIKPSNVIFVHGVPKLADIGLVSTIDTSQSFVGTEGFVPPEGPGAAAADIFSLGKVLYEIGTGRDRNDFPNLPEDLETMPDRRALLELNEIILKACDGEARRRYSSAAAMRDDLLLVQAGRSVRQLHLVERRLRFIAKYGVAATIISTLAVAGFLWASAQTRAARQNLERAERAERDALTRLHDANFNWIRANRLTGRPGQRHDSLTELAKVAARSNRLDLRNEAIACLMLPDVRPVKSWAKTPRWDSFNLSADFQLYGTNDQFGNLFIRDAASDELQHELPSHGFPLAAAMGSGDNRFVFAADVSGRAWIWTLADRRAREIPFAPGSRFLGFTPDHGAIVLNKAEGAIQIVNCTNGASDQIPGDFHQVRSLVFNSMGNRFACAEQPDLTLLHIHRRRDGTRRITLTIPGIISAFAWHPDGRHIAVAWSKHLGLWNTETGEQKSLSAGHEAAVVGLAFNPTGDWLASASWDRTTRFWHTETGREILAMIGSGNSLRVSSDGRQLAYKSWDNAWVHLHEVAETSATRRFPLLLKSGFVANATFSPDGNLLAIAADSAIQVCSLVHPSVMTTLPVPRTANAEFSADGHMLYTGGDKGVQPWRIKHDPHQGELRLEKADITRAAGPDVRSVFRSGDGSRLVVQHKDASMSSLDPRQPENVLRADLPIGPQNIVHVNRDGSLAASWSERARNQLCLWNPQNGKVVTNLTDTVAHLAAVFSLDNRWLATSTAESTVIRSVHDWKERHRIKHAITDGRHRLAFSPDSRTLAVAVSDRELWLIDAASGAQLAAIPTDRMLSSLVFHPDGGILAATYESGYVQLWNLRLLRKQLAEMNLDWPEANE